MMMQIQKTIENMMERLWNLIKNITIGAPRLLLRTVWKVVVGCSKAACWCVRMAGLLIWRSLWWGVGAVLRAAGMKKAVVVAEPLVSCEASAASSSSGELSEESAESEEERPRQLTARRGIGSTVVSVETGAEWGYVSGVSEDGKCWKLSTGRFAKKNTMDIVWKWKPMKQSRPVRAVRQVDKPVRRSAKKFVCRSAEEAVALLAKHRARDGRIEITIE